MRAPSTRFQKSHHLRDRSRKREKFVLASARIVCRIEEILVGFVSIDVLVSGYFRQGRLSCARRHGCSRRARSDALLRFPPHSHLHLSNNELSSLPCASDKSSHHRLCPLRGPPSSKDLLLSCEEPLAPASPRTVRSKTPAPGCATFDL